MGHYYEKLNLNLLDVYKFLTIDTTKNAVPELETPMLQNLRRKPDFGETSAPFGANSKPSERTAEERVRAQTAVLFYIFKFLIPISAMCKHSKGISRC
jgi:hypothetical protein